MRTQGKITHWNADKGYGFITPSAGAKQVFVHINAFGSAGRAPRPGDRVSFALSTDRNGRPCAVRVTRAGEQLSGEIKRNDAVLWSLGALLFLAVVVMAVALEAVPVAILLVYLTASALTFAVYAWDKSAAQARGQRTPEKTLHLLALAGGWPGALIAQQILRHKSRKASFRNVFWATVIINCGVFAWLSTASGEQWLRLALDAFG